MEFDYEDFVYCRVTAIKRWDSACSSGGYFSQHACSMLAHNPHLSNTVMTSYLAQPHFQDATKAREYLEQLRWPNAVVCPHCDVIGNHYAIKAKSKNGARAGLYKCRDCHQQFTVTVGTIFEG